MGPGGSFIRFNEPAVPEPRLHLDFVPLGGELHRRWVVDSGLGKQWGGDMESICGSVVGIDYGNDPLRGARG